MRLSFNKIRSISIIKSSYNKESRKEANNLEFDNNVEMLHKLIDSYDAIKLKKILNIMILLKYNNFNKHIFLITIPKIKDIFQNYKFLELTIEDFLNYLSKISEKNQKSIANDEEFIINKDLYDLSIKLIENKIKILQNEVDNNQNTDSINNLNNISLSNSKHSDIPNKTEDKLKYYIEIILNINEELKVYTNILKDLEDSIKKSYQNIINNFRILLSDQTNEIKNEEIMKITDNNDDKNDELKISIENDIAYINKKYEEIDIFFNEIEKNINFKENKIKNVNILIDRLIDTKVNLENENNMLLTNKKETEKNINFQFIKADEEISELYQEKKNLEKELMEQIQKMKQIEKINNKTIKELENEKDMKIQEINYKINEINKLKEENRNYKNKYDSLLNELIQINNNKEKIFQNYENQLIVNALNNISKNKNINEHRNKFININIEQLFEQYFKLEEKYLQNNKFMKEKEKLIIEKNKRINQLENDLELYREKAILLKQENNNLKDEIKFKNINNEQDRNSFNLENLVMSTSIQNGDEKSGKNNVTIFNNENEIKNNTEEKLLQQTNSGNLFAPPCFTNDGENDDENININVIKSDIFSFDKNVKIEENNNKLLKGKDDKKKYTNTPDEGFKNSKNNKKDNEVINSFIIESSINPYFNNIDERKSNLNNESSINLFKLNNSNNDIIQSFNKLNINEEFNKNNEPLKNNNNIIDMKDDDNKENINNSLNKKIENSFSIREMKDILLNNYENKVNISSYDYLFLNSNPKIKEIFEKIGEDYILEDIFSDIIYLLDKFEQLYKNIMFITKKCIYIIEPESYKIKYTFVKTILLRFTLSSINCNIIVFHFKTGNDLVLMTLRRPELISYFIKSENYDSKNKNEIKFRYADEFNIKKDGEYYTQKIKTSMNSTSFNFQTAIKLGYLIKINEGYIFTQYHEKLVVLTDFGLFYFNNPTVAPKKLISIIGAEINDLKNKFGEKLFCFEIIAMNKYNIVFGSYCKNDYEEWLEKLKEIKKKYENRKIFFE